MKILFLHGWTSVPGGRKPTFLKEHGHHVLNPKLPDEDFEEAVAIAQGVFKEHQPDVVVGSSRGGAVAMNLGVRWVYYGGAAVFILLAPITGIIATISTIPTISFSLFDMAGGSFFFTNFYIVFSRGNCFF